jgi:hypothetical protein
MLTITRPAQSSGLLLSAALAGLLALVPLAGAVWFSLLAYDAHTPLSRIGYAVVAVIAWALAGGLFEGARDTLRRAGKGPSRAD